MIGPFCDENEIKTRARSLKSDLALHTYIIHPLVQDILCLSETTHQYYEDASMEEKIAMKGNETFFLKIHPESFSSRTD